MPAVAELAETWFGAGLSDVACRRLGELGSIRMFPAGTTIYTEGQSTPCLGVVTEGRAQFRRRVHGRDDATLATIERGDVFGWTALGGSGRAAASVLAVTDVTAIVVEAGALRELLEGDEHLAAEVYRRLFDAIARSVEHFHLQLMDMYG